MTGGVNCGGGTTHGLEQLVCVLGAPPVYKGVRGEADGLGGGRAKGGVLLPPGVGLLLSLVGVGEGKGEGQGRKGAPPFPSPIRTSPWGGVRPPFGAFLTFPVWPIKAQYEFP